MAKTEPVKRSNSAPNENPRIEVESLCKVYGARNEKAARIARCLADDGVKQQEIQKRTGCLVAVHNVSFEIRHRETFVIIGLGFESGLAVVILAMLLDRLTQSIKKSPADASGTA